MRALADEVLDWYAESARDLPWRHPAAGPWAVLVSEVMLQQTPVVRVLPAYRDWLARWPSPAALSAAPAGEAVRQWGRLGYPRRSLRLHAAATAIVDRHGGVVPDRLADLLALPGVGDYTARAVSSFAFGQRHPVVDTNVRRVLARALTGVAAAGPATTTADLRRAEEILPSSPARAARCAAALMELGALVCTARAPRCATCPLRDRCAWRAGAGPGTPAMGGPAGRAGRPRPAFTGTDRDVRGRLLAVLRERTGPVPAAELVPVWPGADQRDRAMAGLITDGLARVVAGGYALPD